MKYFHYFIKSAVISLLIFQLMRFVSSINSSETNVYDLTELDKAYAQSIQLPIPADSLDVLICEYPEICGNSSEEELRRIFAPDLLKEPYLGTLVSKYQQLKIIPYYDKDIGSYEKNSRKISLEVSGEVKSLFLVEVWERYNSGYKTIWGYKTVSLMKTCTFESGKWTVKVSKTSVSYQ